MKLKITIILTFFIGFINAQSAWEDVGSPYFLGMNDVEDLVILDDGTPVVAFAAQNTTLIKIKEWRGNTWHNLPS